MPGHDVIQSPEVSGLSIAQVALDTPLRQVFDYRAIAGVVPGCLVSVPFGQRQMVGVVMACTDSSELPLDKLKPVLQVWQAWPVLSADWLELCAFAARYYLRGVGEVMLPALPGPLRQTKTWAKWTQYWQQPAWRLVAQAPQSYAASAAAIRVSLSARAKKAQALLASLEQAALATSAGWLLESEIRAGWHGALTALTAWQKQGWLEQGWVPRCLGAAQACDRPTGALPVLQVQQQAAVDALMAASRGGGYAPFLLHGVTGSGKTEVYLRLIADILARDPLSQVLLLVPEINLTPQLEGTVRNRFPGVPLAMLHSGLAEGERATHWLAAHLGQARIVLGTRLAILASLPGLAAIVVDEEHDASYKQQEGLRYSARDLAIWRARQRGIPVVLGSATPSLESWWRAHPTGMPVGATASLGAMPALRQRYTLLTLSERAQTDAVLPTVRMIDLGWEQQRKRALTDGLSKTLLEAIRQRLSRGEQSLLYLNRRGYAPVLSCDACGWLSGCPRCSAFLVLHKAAPVAQRGPRIGTLHCHHCGLEAPVPRHCPDCGNIDLAPLGRGTQRMEETLASQFPSARIARIDADSTRRKGSAQALFDDVHAGEVDILVGTQMVAKGHDFQRVSLVAILNPDAALFSHDFRAGERLFAQLMQVAGRAGRAGLASEVLVQTRYPQAPIYQALAAHDYAGHAQHLLEERYSVGLPPFSYQALLTADATRLEAALAFLHVAREAAQSLAGVAEGGIMLHDPVPRSMVRVARRERAQLLVESPTRAPLQKMLTAWIPLLEAIRPRVSWQLERDPASI